MASPISPFEDSVIGGIFGLGCGGVMEGFEWAFDSLIQKEEARKAERLQGAIARAIERVKLTVKKEVIRNQFGNTGAELSSKMSQGGGNPRGS